MAVTVVVDMVESMGLSIWGVVVCGFVDGVARNWESERSRRVVVRAAPW
jgi:hypothetical protein